MYYLICEMGLIYLCFTFFIVVSNYLNAWNKSKTSKSSYSFRLCQTASPLGYTVWQYILKKKKKKIEQDQSNLHSWLNEKQQNCRINDYQGVYVKCFLCVKTLKKKTWCQSLESCCRLFPSSIRKTLCHTIPTGHKPFLVISPQCSIFKWLRLLGNIRDKIDKWLSNLRHWLVKVQLIWFSTLQLVFKGCVFLRRYWKRT